MWMPFSDQMEIFYSETRSANAFQQNPDWVKKMNFVFNEFITPRKTINNIYKEDIFRISVKNNKIVYFQVVDLL